MTEDNIVDLRHVTKQTPEQWRAVYDQIKEGDHVSLTEIYGSGTDDSMTGVRQARVHRMANGEWRLGALCIPINPGTYLLRLDIIEKAPIPVPDDAVAVWVWSDDLERRLVYWKEEGSTDLWTTRAGDTISRLEGLRRFYGAVHPLFEREA